MIGLFKKKKSIRDLVSEVEVEKKESTGLEIEEGQLLREDKESEILKEKDLEISGHEEIENSIVSEKDKEDKEAGSQTKDIGETTPTLKYEEKIEEPISNLEDSKEDKVEFQTEEITPKEVETESKEELLTFKDDEIERVDNKSDLEEILEKETDTQEKLEKSKDEVKEEPFVEKNVDEAKDSLFKKLKRSLSKTKDSLFRKLNDIFNSDVIDEDLLDDLEEALFTSDIGVKTTELIIENIRERIKVDKTEDPKLLKEIIFEEIIKLVKTDNNLVEANFKEKPYVILVVGVNGNGKTTTIGKLAKYYKDKGKKVLIGAADTFRAAAIEQLEEWARRADVDFVKDKMNSDPAAVAYNSYEAAVARDCDIVMIDTAGRLHNKINLMKELEKISKVLKKKNMEAPHEVLLVLDATTGQNAVSQAKNFNISSGVTGLVLTKLDGTAKGGVAIAINQELNIPIKFIGIGEKIDDIKEFDPKEYVSAMFD
ncbi:MAG: signal recognition particle-docking protein FtsY [Candidatus Cloacimonadota bacterium]|nr:MAG: signal recognition particle-docking protein FtsY [Candidatus Cloacimonadota bacterium]PIE81113.1 MAG: signal recognition particle-docking protein FtsY [Candidatus Delongbacteria bacterium]